MVKCVIRVRGREGEECAHGRTKETRGAVERGEVAEGGPPTEWNHNLLTGGWKRGAQVRCEVKAVTTRSPLLRREMIIHPLAPRHAAGSAAAPRLTLNERFHLKTLPALSRAPTTTRIARVTNARGGLSVGTSQRRNSAIVTVAFDKERLARSDENRT